MRRLLVAAAIVVVLVASAVGLGSLLLGSGGASAIAAEYFEAVRNADYDAAIGCFSPEVFGRAGSIPTPDEWREQLIRLHGELGELSSYRLVGWSGVASLNGTGSSGNRYELTYEVAYSKGTTMETLVIHIPLNGDATSARLVGYSLDSYEPLR
jgi:hypothetical protein